MTPLRISAYITAILGLALAIAFGWDRGADVLIDFGRELYVPWRLVEGEVLHREIGWFNGPLGPWVLEGWMRVFGVSLDAVQWLNTLVIGLTALALARLLERAASGFAAWLGVLVFASVFAVAQQEASGNFLFLSPYSHGITFGFCASLWALLAVLRVRSTGSATASACAGALAGLVFLTKAEIFLGLAIGLGAVGLAVTLSRETVPHRVRAACAFTLGFCGVIALAYARFTAQLESTEAATIALLGTWIHAFNSDVSDLPFYRMMRGTYDLHGSLRRLAMSSALVPLHVGACYAIAALAALRTSAAPRTLWILGAGIGAGATAAAGILAPIKWMLLPLVFFLPITVLYALVHASRRGVEDREHHHRALALLALAALGLGLQPKVLLVPLARQYGFVLSVPGTLLAAAFLVHWIPRRPRFDGRLRAALAGAGVGIVALFALLNLNATRNWFSGKTLDFAAGADRIRVRPWRGEILESVRRHLAETLPQDATLLVLPEGVTLNYALRLRTATRLVNYMAPELVMFSEHDVVEDLERTPPDAVVFVHRPTDIYGYSFFGEGYGEGILAWVRGRYARDEAWGDPPFERGEPGAFGAELWLPARAASAQGTR